MLLMKSPIAPIFTPSNHQMKQKNMAKQRIQM